MSPTTSPRNSQRLGSRHKSVGFSYKDAIATGNQDLWVSRDFWVSLVLLLAFMPLGVFGWSLHSLLPGHQHEHCGHFHWSSDLACVGQQTIIHSHEHDETHHHKTDELHSHSNCEDPSSQELLVHDSTVPSPAQILGQTQILGQVQVLESDHDCQLCKVLQQLRFSKTQVANADAGELTVPTRILERQNAILASLDAYFLRGPPMV